MSTVTLYRVLTGLDAAGEVLSSVSMSQFSSFDFSTDERMTWGLPVAYTPQYKPHIRACTATIKIHRG